MDASAENACRRGGRGGVGGVVGVGAWGRGGVWAYGRRGLQARVVRVIDSALSFKIFVSTRGEMKQNLVMRVREVASYAPTPYALRPTPEA